MSMLAQRRHYLRRPAETLVCDMQKWRKLGKIFDASGQFEWMQTHAAVPIVSDIRGDLITTLFSCRDRLGRSSLARLDFNIRSRDVVYVHPRPLLRCGDVGLFDDSGVMASCIVRRKHAVYLYYIGWNLGVTVPFRNSIGIAESKDGGKSFDKMFNGPILDRTKLEPHFTASCCVLSEEEVFKMWYVSCTGWDTTNGKLSHRYHIKYAESEDGIHWSRDGVVAIDYKDQFEYAISVPRVIKEDGRYKMWFSSRADPYFCGYRIRYAESDDGKFWQRRDEEVILPCSNEGWDSEMICYPYIFDHENKRYMLYNGNGFGQTGFGLAVLERS
jgi:hypothetical protein